MIKKTIDAEAVQIGKRIEEERIRRNLTQDVMAENMGIGTASQYRGIINGANNITYMHLINLYRNLGVSVEYILLGKVERDEQLEFEFEKLDPINQVKTITRILSYLCGQDKKQYEKIFAKVFQELEK